MSCEFSGHPVNFEGCKLDVLSYGHTRCNLDLLLGSTTSHPQGQGRRHLVGRGATWSLHGTPYPCQHAQKDIWRGSKSLTPKMAPSSYQAPKRQGLPVSFLVGDF